MDDQLVTKTEQYEALLEAACARVHIAPEEHTRLGQLADEHLEMATAYLEDGKHFSTEDDLPNALASFAYGHGWLDAAIRAGLLTEDDRDV